MEINMKKFSSKTGDKINSEPKNIPDDQPNDIKWELMRLIDDNIKITSYSYPIEHILPTVKITGQEDLIEAILLLFKEKKNISNIEILESLKLKMGDWKTLDEKIQSLETSIKNAELKDKYKNHIDNIEKDIKNWGSDIKSFEILIETKISKIKNQKLIDDKIEACKILLEKSSEKESFLLNRLIEKLLNKKQVNKDI